MKLLGEVRGRGLVSVGLQAPNVKLTNFVFFVININLFILKVDLLCLF